MRTIVTIGVLTAGAVTFTGQTAPVCDSGCVWKKVTIAAAAVAILLAGCSSASDSDSAGAGDRTSARPAKSSSAPAASPSAEPIGVSLASDWVSTALERDKSGYFLTVNSTSDPDVYDGRLSFRESDGAIDNSQFVTLTLTGPSTMSVRWADASEQTGSFVVNGDATKAVTLVLGQGCVDTLPSDAAPDNCVFRPRKGNAAATESASPTPESSTAFAVPATDEAMSYLCSTSSDDLARVTSSKSDAFAVAVLQVALTQIGYDPGPIDGRYGSLSKDAVRSYQAAAGLTVDGLVGPKTWTSLQAAACSVAEDPAG